MSIARSSIDEKAKTAIDRKKRERGEVIECGVGNTAGAVMSSRWMSLMSSPLC